MEIAQRRQAIEPREISQVTDTHLRISWADEKVCNYDAARLRLACPCAQCVNEWTGERTLKAEAISDEELSFLLELGAVLDVPLLDPRALFPITLFAHGALSGTPRGRGPAGFGFAHRMMTSTPLP